MNKSFFWLLLLSFLTACQSYPLAPKQYAKSKKGVVAAAHPLAARAGRMMLARGGNAADAAVASAFALAVVEPSMSGLGGRLQAIIQQTDGSVHGIDATSQTPIGYDTAVIKPQRFGYTTIGIPGVVAGLTKLLADHGTLPLEVIMAPAIDYAQNGFIILPMEADRHQEAIPELQQFPGSQQYFLKTDRQSYAAGDLWIQKDLAEVLKAIAKGGKTAFYEGPIAQKIAADIQANGGCVALEDLKNYQAYDSKIVTGSYRGYDLHGLWLPSYGAITIEILHILEQFPMNQLSEADRLLVTAEAMRLAYKDRKQQYAEGEPAKLLTSKAYAKEQARKITQAQVGAKMSYLGNTPESWTVEQGHTTHLTVVDEQGMIIALTQSLGPNMGSKVASPGLGFLYAVTLGSYLGMYEPGQRVSSHISPFLVSKDGKPYMGLGAAGGSRIVTAIAQVISRVVDQEMDLDDALAAARVYPEGDLTLLELHPGTNWEQKTLQSLKQKSAKIKSIPEPAKFGRVHAIQFKNNKWVGAADPDWEGAVSVPNKKEKE